MRIGVAEEAEEANHIKLNCFCFDEYPFRGTWKKSTRSSHNTLIPVGGSGLYLVVDEKEQFREDDFLRLQDTFTKQKQMGGNQSRNSKSSGRIAEGGNASGGSDIYKIVKLNMKLLNVTLHYDGVFVPKPLKYVLGLTMIINDTQFEEMPVSELFEFVDSRDLKNAFMVDLYHEYNDYDVMANTTNDNLFPNKDDNLGDDKTVVEQEKGNYIGTRENPIPPLSGHVEEVNPQDADIDPKFKAQTDVQYPSYNPDLPWKEFMPVLGMKFDNPQQLKHALADYGVANGIYIVVFTGVMVNSLLDLLWHYVNEIVMNPSLTYRFIREDIREKFMIDEYRQAVLESNPGSTCHLDVDFNNYSQPVFHRMYVCFKGVKDGWIAGCRKVIGIDGCFITIVQADDLDLQEGLGVTIISDSHKGAAASTIEQDFTRYMEHIRQLDLEVYRYLMEREPERWSKAYFQTGRSCASFKNGISESFNAQIIDAKVAAFLHFKLNPDDGVSSWYTQSKWFDTYHFSIKLFYGSKMWKKNQNTPPLPPIMKRMPGRPRKNRIPHHTKEVNKHSISRVDRVITCQNCQKTGHNKASCKDPKATEPAPMKPPRAPTVYESSGQGKARGPKVSALRNVSASGAKGGSSKDANGAKGGVSKGGASKGASGAKGEASKSVSARGAKSGAASGAKSISVKRGAASGANVAKRGTAKSNSAHSSMNTHEAAKQVMQEEMEEEKRRRLVVEEEHREYQYNLEMEWGHFSDNENDRPATINELQALKEAHV
ncbi:hypothetical protein Tco_0844145 [Tanacetum coccineum]